MTARLLAILALTSATLSAACGEASYHEYAPPTPVVVSSAAFRADVVPVLRNSCATQFCHFTGPNNAATGQLTLDSSTSLSADQIYANLIAGGYRQSMGLVLDVDPAHVDASALLSFPLGSPTPHSHILDGTSVEWASMQAWIAAGAVLDTP